MCNIYKHILVERVVEVDFVFLQFNLAPILFYLVKIGPRDISMRVILFSYMSFFTNHARLVVYRVCAVVFLAEHAPETRCMILPGKQQNITYFRCKIMLTETN